MGRKADQERTRFLEAAAEMYEELHGWRKQNRAASLDEIAGQVTRRRRGLMV